MRGCFGVLVVSISETIGLKFRVQGADAESSKTSSSRFIVFVLLKKITVVHTLTCKCGVLGWGCTVVLGLLMVFSDVLMVFSDVLWFLYSCCIHLSCCVIRHL